MADRNRGIGLVGKYLPIIYMENSLQIGTSFTYLHHLSEDVLKNVIYYFLI